MTQLASGRGAHAWLLTGPRGAGKRNAARAMAAALTCRVEPGVGCGECSTCRRVVRNRYPDLHVVVPEGAVITVEAVREGVLAEAARSPFEGTSKVFVLEEADRMNPPAQSVLLKTLEEPPADTFFILISQDERELLETVRSRCRTIRLEAASKREIVEALARDGVAEEQARFFGHVADGDLERAALLASEPAMQERRRLWLSIPSLLTSPVAALDVAGAVSAAVAEAVGAREAAQKEEITELAEAMGEGRGTASARNALAKRHKRELRRVQEEVLGEALETIASYCRDVVAFRAAGRDAVVNVDAVEMLQAAAASGAPDEAFVRAAERCLDARAALVRNANQALVIEATLAAMSQLIPPAAASTRQEPTRV